MQCCHKASIHRRHIDHLKIDFVDVVFASIALYETYIVEWWVDEVFSLFQRTELFALKAMLIDDILTNYVKLCRTVPDQAQR